MCCMLIVWFIHKVKDPVLILCRVICSIIFWQDLLNSWYFIRLSVALQGTAVDASASFLPEASLKFRWNAIKGDMFSKLCWLSASWAGSSYANIVFSVGGWLGLGNKRKLSWWWVDPMRSDKDVHQAYSTVYGLNRRSIISLNSVQSIASCVYAMLCY